LFDRESGKPLFDIEERPHPGSDIEGEKAWPTQPIPVKPPPFARQSLDENGLTNISPQAHAFARKEMRKFRSGSPHIPPSLQGSILLPGFHGGANWSGASFDPETGLLFVNSNNVANVTKLIPTPDKPFPFRFAGYTKFLDQEGYPATKPPWGQLSAIDLNRGEIVWTKTLGEFPELTARGIPPTGTESFGGTIVTKGGVVFIAGTMDEKFRAFDKTTGELLWQTKLPAAGYATPCTYRANGRQYVCIAAGGAGKLKTPVGDSFVTFALPAKSKVDAVQIQGHSSSKE
jgi:quinoprotein glucose dehydrogenase